jgi:hypothetical protein
MAKIKKRGLKHPIHAFGLIYINIAGFILILP